MSRLYFIPGSSPLIRQLAEAEVEHLKDNMNYVYAIYNKDYNKIYIGQTEDLQRRIEQHNNHEYKNTYTSIFPGEWVVIHNESLATRSEALVREKQLKSFRGREFVKSLINNPR